MNNLRHNLLTYIGYIQKGQFLYDKLSVDFETLGIVYKNSSLRKEFSLLKKEGLISFKLYYNKPVPILTTKGKLAIKTQLAFKKYGLWDGKWRLVIFDLPQKERNYRLFLVDKLIKIGFAPISRGAYISTFPLLGIVEKMANHWGIRQHVSFMTVEKIDNLTNALKIWRLEDINEKYANFIKMTERTKKYDRLWAIQAKEIEQTFADIFALDPHLPDELLPANWQGKKAYTVFKQISNSY